MEPIVIFAMVSAALNSLAVFAIVYLLDKVNHLEKKLGQ